VQPGKTNETEKGKRKDEHKGIAAQRIIESYLIIKFFASGILLKSISTFAIARISALADMVLRKSVTVAFPETAVNAPNAPTTKYWNVRAELCGEEVR
jgi:hypothetical protein